LVGIHSFDYLLFLGREIIQTRDKGVDGVVEGGDLELKDPISDLLPFQSCQLL
jgi:hypothetical protein